MFKAGYTRNCKLDKLACSIFLYKDAQNPSPPHGTCTLEQTPVCTPEMSSSDNDALALAAFVLVCKRKPRKKKRDVVCKDWLRKGKPIPTLVY
jgi:hypothetical protein